MEKNAIINTVTIDNIESFVGKTLICDPYRWHHYPLKISKRNDSYYYTDRNGVMMRFEEHEKIAYTATI